MANALNVRLINNVTSIAQGDNASTVILELLDNNRLIMPFLDGKTALINFISGKNEIQYQTTAPVFDSRIEFNVDAVLPHGKYNVEVRIEDEDASYVFPSSVNYMLTIHKSANDFYNVAVEVNGVEVIVHEVYQRLEAENPGLLEHVDRRDNPHGTTKSQVGLGNVDNVKQASKQEFDEHAEDSTIHVTQAEKQSWDSKATQEDIDDAVEGLDFVSNQSFTGHVGNEDLHWKEGERDSLHQQISNIETDIQNHEEDKTKHITALGDVVEVEKSLLRIDDTLISGDTLKANDGNSIIVSTSTKKSEKPGISYTVSIDGVVSTATAMLKEDEATTNQIEQGSSAFTFISPRRLKEVSHTLGERDFQYIVDADDFFQDTGLSENVEGKILFTQKSVTFSLTCTVVDPESTLIVLGQVMIPYSSFPSYHKTYKNILPRDFVGTSFVVNSTTSLPLGNVMTSIRSLGGSTSINSFTLSLLNLNNIQGVSVGDRIFINETVQMTPTE